MGGQLPVVAIHYVSDAREIRRVSLEAGGLQHKGEVSCLIKRNNLHLKKKKKEEEEVGRGRLRAVL